jgi:hypothetical protein
MAKIEVELADGAKAGESLKELTKEAAKLRKEVAGLPKGTKEFVDAAKKLNEVDGSIKDLKEEIKGTTDASEMLKNAWSNLPGASMFNQVSDSLGMAKKGVGGLSSQFGILKTAIAATGIGLILIALAALISLFKTFTPIVDKVEQILGGISGVVAELTNRFQDFGAGLWKIITGAPGGVEQLSDAFKGLGDSIKKSYEEGVKLAELQQDLDDRNRGIAISNAEAEASIDRLIVQSKNRTLAEKERLTVLEGAEKVAIQNFEKEKKLAIDNLNLTIMQAKQKSKLSEDEILQLAEGTLAQEIEYEKRGTLDDDLLEKIADNRVAVINLEGKNNVLLEKINNQRDKLREEQEAKEAKAAEARDKQRAKEAAELQKKLEEQKKYWDTYYANLRNLEDMQVQAMSDSREKDLAQLKLNLQRQIEALDENAPFYAERMVAAQELGRQQRAAVNEKWNKIDKEKEQARIDAQLKTIEDGARDEELIVLEALATRQINEEQFNDELFNIQARNLEQQLELLEQAGQEKTEKYQEIYGNLLNLNIEHNRKIEENDKQRFMATVSGASQLAGALAESYQADIDAQQARVDRAKELHGEESLQYKLAQNELVKIKRENGNKQKRAERTQVALNLITEISSIWQGAATLGPIVGPILGAALTAAALIRSNAALKKIDSTQYAKGGVIHGPSHAQGGVPFTVNRQPGFEAEGGEVIINKRSASRFRRQLSAINSFSNWGRRFEAGGPVSPWRDQSRGSMASPMPSAMNGNTDDLLRELIQETRSTREDLAGYKRSNDTRIDRIKVSNNLQDTQKGLDTLNRIQSEADV